MTKLLEREPLLASMLEASKRAASGRGGMVLVEGEAGIGKTSLLQEFAAQAGQGARLAWGWCEALVTARPLGPLQDMGRALDARVAQLLEEGAPPDRLFPALFNMLQDADEPTVLIFEDVHWADNATMDLLRYLGRRISLMPALVVLSAIVAHPSPQTADVPQGIQWIGIAPIGIGLSHLIVYAVGKNKE